MVQLTKRSKFIKIDLKNGLYYDCLLLSEVLWQPGKLEYIYICAIFFQSIKEISLSCLLNLKFIPTL